MESLGADVFEHILKQWRLGASEQISTIWEAGMRMVFG